jgi:large repetitive protein
MPLARRAFSITVNEVTQPPRLILPDDRIVDELAPLTMTVSASDPNLPANTLTLALVSGPPGLVFDPATGVISWTPTEAQGPGAYRVVISVTTSNPDNPDHIPLTVSGSFAIVVREVNHPPVLEEIDDFSIEQGVTLEMQARASDPDLPVNTLSFRLETAPEGMEIDPDSGVILWTPGEGQAGTHVVTVQVTDSGAPPLSATTSFEVTVRTDDPDFEISLQIRRSSSGPLEILVFGETGVDYEFEFSPDLALWQSLSAFRMEASPHAIGIDDPAAGSDRVRFYRVKRD